MVVVVPQKPCYRAGEKLGMLGRGYTPSGSVRVTSDGAPIGSVTTLSNGAFAAQLTVGQRRGEKVKTYAATDVANPAITAATALRVSALAVSIRPRSGRPGRRLRIGARGFTGYRTLYAHVARGRRYRRNVRVGRLTRVCRKLTVRRRIIARRTRPGSYLVQFDGRRRFSRRTRVRVRFRVRVSRTARRASAGAASVATGERWERID